MLAHPFVDQISRPAGYRYFLSRITNYSVAHVAPMTAPCMDCGSWEAKLFPVVPWADFNTSVLPSRLRRGFLSRAVGICTKCGLTQEFHRFQESDITEWIGTLSSKDMAVSEEAFHSEIVPQSYIEKFNGLYFNKRISRWRESLNDLPKPKRVLFFRPFFGAAPQFFIEQYGSHCSALEISRAARKTIESKLPSVEFLEGNIHAMLSGSFLNSGCYDAVVVCHTLVHSIDVHKMLSQIQLLLKPGGFALFTHEVNVKPNNPFHMLFVNEERWQKMLAQHFSSVRRIADCDDVEVPHISKYTIDGKSPDFVAIRD